MATAIPDFPSFDVDTDPTGLAQRWKKWLARYENLIIALDITDPRRKKALLLHYAGQGVHEHNTADLLSRSHHITNTEWTLNSKVVHALEKVWGVAKDRPDVYRTDISASGVHQSIPGDTSLCS